LAHALGKATVVVTTDPGTLPADLRGANALIYRPGKMPVAELALRIRDAANGVTNGLTHSSYEHISVAAGRHQVFLSWNSFADVLHFCQLARHTYQVLYDGVFANLVRVLEPPARGASAKLRRANQWQDAWHPCDLHYAQIESQMGLGHDDWDRSVRAKWQNVKAVAAAVVPGTVAECDSSIEAMIAALRAYAAKHRAISQVFRELDSTDPGRFHNLRRDTHSLSIAAHQVAMHADRGLTGLVALVRYDKDGD
jgi:hypothetical protein